MRKGKDWNAALSYDGENRSIKPGAYICKIISMKEELTRNNRVIVKLAFDIAEGEYENYYMTKFVREKSGDKNATYKGVYRVFPETQEGATNPYFKGLITSIEKSNNFELPDEFDDRELKGKLFGALFRKREWEKDKWVTEIGAIRTVENIREGKYTLPEDKSLNTNYASTAFSAYNDDDDDDLPF